VKQSCGSSILADGRLADLIRRVATFGMVLMKLDVRQVYATISTAAYNFSDQNLPLLRKSIAKIQTLIEPHIYCFRNQAGTQKHLMPLRLTWILVFIVSGMKKRSWIS
jgi:hypothetical protein